MDKKESFFKRTYDAIGHSLGFSNFTLENPDRQINGFTVAQILGGGDSTASGEDVNEQKALTFSAVWACVRAYSGPFSYFPINIYRETRNRKEKIDHSLLKLFKQPLPYMNGNTLMERAAMHYTLWGNCYIEPIRVSRLKPITGFFIHHPSKVKVIKKGDGVDQKIIYEITSEDGDARRLSPDRIIHVANLGDGVVGIPPISRAREDIGLELARRRYGSKYFGQGGKFDGVLSVKSRLNDKQYQDLVDKHAIAKKNGGDLITNVETEYTPYSIPPEDSQFLETGFFSVNTIARWFGVPPWKIQDLQQGSTFRNIEEMGIAFLKDSLAPMVEKFECELNTKLARDLDGAYINMDMERYIRADAMAVAEQNRTGIQNAYKTPNQVREYNGDNPIEGGDRLFIQSNMVPLDLIDNIYNSEEGQQMIAQMLADKLYNKKE